MSEPNRPKRNSSEAKAKDVRTLEVVPNSDEMVKASELIEVRGGTGLTLADRRLFNALLQNAHGPDLANGNQRFTIPTADLRDSHDSNDRLVKSIEALMRTVVTIARPDGSTDRVQLLGWNNLSDPKRPRGVLTYSLPPELAAILGNSKIFAKLQLEVLGAFTTKYGLALYEALARRKHLSHKFTDRFSLDNFRELLGVPVGKLATYANFNKTAIQPAIREVNALSEIEVTILPEKTGRKVTGVIVGWSIKDIERRKEAFAELQRHRAGRKARIDGTAEAVISDD